MGLNIPEVGWALEEKSRVTGSSQIKNNDNNNKIIIIKQILKKGENRGREEISKELFFRVC